MKTIRKTIALLGMAALVALPLAGCSESKTVSSTESTSTGPLWTESSAEHRANEIKAAHEQAHERQAEERQEAKEHEAEQSKKHEREWSSSLRERFINAVAESAPHGESTSRYRAIGECAVTKLEASYSQTEAEAGSSSFSNAELQDGIICGEQVPR